jgi:hypothetical protein
MFIFVKSFGIWIEVQFPKYGKTGLRKIYAMPYEVCLQEPQDGRDVWWYK